MPTYANGKICYVDIPASDIAASAEFYQTVFGWEVRTRGRRIYSVWRYRRPG